MPVLQINNSNFLKGMSLTDYSGDKGFSPLSKGFEVDRTSRLGLLQAGRSLVDQSTNLDSPVVAKVKHLRSNTLYYYLVCANSKIFESGTGLSVTNTLKDTASGKTFSAGQSYAFDYKGKLYITSTTDIYYDDFTFATPDKTWWTTTKGKTALTAGVPHKMFEFGDVLYILNGNVIASWNGTTATDAAFTLPTGWIITDAEIDNDVIYLTIVKSVNDYATYTETKIIVWNGVSTTTYLREIPVYTPPISAIKKADTGFIFFAGRDIYFFDGYNYQWLRNITTVPNFNQITSFNGNVYFVDYQSVGAYNSRLKIFTYPIYYTGNITSLGISFLDYIDLFTDDNKRYQARNNNYSGATFFSNWYELGNVKIKKIVFGLDGALATNSTYVFSIYNEAGTQVYSKTISKALDGAKSVIVKNNINKNVCLAQFRLAFNNAANSPLRFIHIYYDPLENYVGH